MPLMALTYDWIAENLYVATYDGHILVCNGDARVTRTFRCVHLLETQINLRAIAVDPIEG